MRFAEYAHCSDRLIIDSRRDGENCKRRPKRHKLSARYSGGGTASDCSLPAHGVSKHERDVFPGVQLWPEAITAATARISVASREY